MQHLIGEEKERTLVRAVLSLFLLVTKRLYGKEREWSIGQIKTCRKKQHVEIDDMKEMSDLFCGKAAVGGNYNSTRDSEAGKFKTDAKSLGRLAELGYEFAKDVLEYRTVQSYLRAFKWADGFEDMNGMVRPNVSLTLTNRITYSKPNLIGIRKDVTWNTVAPLTENDVMYSIDIKNEEPTILLNLVGDRELLEGLKSEEGLYNTMFKKVFEPKTVATVILDKSVPSHKMTHKEIMSDPRILGLPSKYSTGCHSIFYEGKEVLAVENIFFSYDGGHSSLPSTVGIELVDGVVDIPVQWDMKHANVDNNGSTVEGRLIGLEINIRKSDRDEFKRSWLSYTYGASLNSIRFGCKYIDGARVADYLGHIKSINKYKSLVKKAVKEGANSATTVFGNQLVVNEFEESKRIRTVMNAPIQGTGADILAISIKRLDDEIARRGWGDVMQMYYTRHDEIVVNVNKEFADAHDKEIKDMLSDVVAFQIVHNGAEWTPLKVEIDRIIPQPIHINIEDAGDEEE